MALSSQAIHHIEEEEEKISFRIRRDKKFKFLVENFNFKCCISNKLTIVQYVRDSMSTATFLRGIMAESFWAINLRECCRVQVSRYEAKL